MAKIDDKAWKPIQKDLERFFYEQYYKPLLDLFDKPIYNSLYNSKSENALIAAIRKGRITYRSGVFSGKFNAEISRELSKYATYNKSSKQWKGVAPFKVTAAATTANSKTEALAQEAKNVVSRMKETVENEVDNLNFRINRSIDVVADKIEGEVAKVTVLPEITEGMREKYNEEYTNNIRLNIVNEGGPGNWNEEQVIRLREAIEKNITRGLSKTDLQRAIMAEWGVTQNKATFLARQETSLLLSTMREDRYTSAGMDWYKWSTSNDNRVVGKPGGKFPSGSRGHGNHFVMQGKICKWSDSSVYADSIADAKKGKWKSKASIGADNKHPGEAYLCRCSPIAILI